MKKTLMALLALSLVLVVPALAATPKGAKTYKASIKAVSPYSGIVGKATLVDGKRKNNNLSISVRGLRSGVTYPWHVHQATGAGDPCAVGSSVANKAPFGDWRYKALKANASGNASATAKSATFPAGSNGNTFYVNVHSPDGTVVACGVLKAQRKKRGARKG